MSVPTKDVTVTVIVGSSNAIGENLLRRLMTMNARGAISAETLRLFLDNPEVVWAGADPLELVWRIVAVASPQDRVAILGDLVWVTKDPAALEQMLEIRRRAGTLEVGTRDNMDENLSSAYLAFGRVAEAVRATERIEHFASRVMAWFHICEHTHQPEHIAHLRQLRDSAPQQVQMRAANHLAMVSRDPKDLACAEQFWEMAAQAVDAQVAGLWRAAHVTLHAEMGEVDRARELVDSIESLNPRIKARAAIVQHTKDEQDFRRLLQEIAEHNIESFRTLRQIAVACLACGKVELVRQMAAHRSHAGERCLLLALASMAEGGTEADLRQAEMAHRSMLKRTGSDSGARQQLVHALNKVGRHRDARLVALRISAPRLRAYTYLTIHRSEVGGDPLPYETENY